MQSSINFVVETALLGQGLVSVSNNRIEELWPDGALVTWLQKGRVVLGSIEEFLYYKEQIKSWRRIDGLKIYDSMNEGVDGFLTASATVKVARDLGYPVAVSAGIGGIGDIIEERLSYDLPALAQTEITLIATSPKDMLDIPGTINWLHNNGVKTFGCGNRILRRLRLLGKKRNYARLLNHVELGSIVRGHN